MKQQGFLMVLAVVLGVMGSVLTGCEQDEFLPEEVTTLEDARNLTDTLPHVCIDKYLESDKQSKEKAAVIGSKLWTNGQTIRIRFLGGDAFLQGKVMQFARQWEEFVNLKFQVVTSGTAEIRIAFEPGGSWSYIGKDAMYVSQSAATMNFGWFKSTTSDQEFSRTTLHEFGHALGMIHEHQHPVAGIPWDTAKVYAYYMGAPNYWTREDVNQNLFTRYNTTQTQFCKYDKLSIMHYAVPEEHTIGTFSVGNNTYLSDEDKSLMTKLYPFIGTRGTTPNCNNIWYTANSGTSPWQTLRSGNASLSELAFGDFNGDKKTDVFRANTTAGRWEVLWSGVGEWQLFQNASIPLNQLGFGDFNGDGKTDVFRNNNRWEVWLTGTTAWRALNTINVAVTNLRFADFNADGKTDVFYINPSTYRWQVSYSGSGAWQTLNSSITSPVLTALAFGDFNGDRRTDIIQVTATTGKFDISYGGTGSWQTLYTQSTPAITALGLADFNGDGKTDILKTTGTLWQVAYGGNTAWQTLRTSVQTISQLAFGDFNGDLKADVLNIR
ncbi:MAG: FG-GAP-like repeat-containing protein [Saprospiraceae bacterium]